MKHLVLPVMIITAFVPTAWAADAPTEKCFPARTAKKTIAKLEGLKPASQDTLEAALTAQFVGRSHTDPQPKLWTRIVGVDEPFTITPDGVVDAFHTRLQALSPDDEICGEVITKDGETSRIGLNIGVDVNFKNTSGPFSLAELQDGVRDGRSFYKKLYPGPMSLMVPKMTHVLVETVLPDFDTLDVTFTREGEPVAPPTIETFGGAYVIALEAIEASGADQMAIMGGPFRLSPSPSIKKLKSLGFGD